MTVAEAFVPARRASVAEPPLPERALSRALRPLKRTSPSLVEMEIDEEATAESAAREGLWVPACVPVRERWMDAVVVVDCGSSMVVWRRTADHLVTVLRRTGGFRDVRVHRLNTDHPLPEDRSPVAGMPPRGKRTVLVLTDGIGAAWADESAQRALAHWARHASVAVLHVLRQGRWHHTGVAPERVRVRVPEPGAPNGTWRRADGGSWPGGAPPVPVLELDARWMANWARLVARPSARGEDTMALLPGAPAERWDPKVGTADPLDETGIGYEFHDGVRELLLSAGMRDESLYILGSVLDRLGRRWKPLLMLRDLLNHPSGPVHDLPKTERLLPYIRLQEQVYQALSGPYLEGARSFRALVLARQALARSGASRSDPVDDASRRGKYVDSEAVDMTYSTTPRPDPQPEADDSPSPPAHGTPGPAAEHLRGTFVSVTAARSLPAVEERQAGEPPSIWGNVPPRNNNFTGRQTLLDTLHERLRSEGTAAVLPEALHGLGGVGKSQIALEYVHQHAADYDAVWWIPAERPEQIRQALVQLADRLGLRAGMEANTAVPSVLDALRTGRPCCNWLLVEDALLTILVEANLSIDVREGGDYLAARDMLEQTCARARQLLPQNAPIGVYALRNLAVTLRLLGEMDEALALNKETLPVLVERLGTDRPTALAFRALVLAHQALARSGESRPDPVEDASQSKKMRSPRRLP